MQVVETGLDRINTDGCLGRRLERGEENIYLDLTSIFLSRKALTLTTWYPHDVEDKRVADLMCGVPRVSRRVRKQVIQRRK